MNKDSRTEHTATNLASVKSLHPAWLALIRHCMQIGHGEIERLKIQDGIPVMIEKSVQRIKLT